MPLRDEGAVAGKMITSTSTSASFWLSVSISWTILKVDSASTLLNRMRATCSVMSSGSALPISHSCTELEDGTSNPIRRKSNRCAIATPAKIEDRTLPHRRHRWGACLIRFRSSAKEVAIELEYVDSANSPLAVHRLYGDRHRQFRHHGIWAAALLGGLFAAAAAFSASV